MTDDDLKIVKGKFYDPKFRQDIVDRQRQRCIDNCHQYYAPHLLSYYNSKKIRIKNYTEEEFEKIEKLLADENTTLHHKGRITPKL